ncbi:SDR family NAD(P)-dependent oxidoreductase [Cocleimonas sp. KMM 6892]|uniref:SDR family NAD(P)-dependent oxidoreductase n=1 Tax=unclassified Cocleimonas TaxID=2639732 RepID=UPI002DBEA27F|nr:MULTISPECIES: SDR family NAD(P)-dependent oxidoreductase [unclassified Cocleimonas]MEB8433021.1 SDR family NAD(P)-dependent oxidoreductase [Cocleimonas sp. KMM 6892]MEC4715998.1 SDR family NAD(P)-dependent oxidoreductase [Cocleimonas sp. KMM 6895]MEC4745459.1 SDR family NAD(P)-dependent oxidoreductase [Cocleimonas sp. KMM 6896]
MKKTILLTGATDGIGLATAKMLLEQGNHLLLHGRNPQKLEDVVNTLSSQVEGANIESYVADLSNLSEVKKFADAVAEKHDSLDVLINNAGVFKINDPMTQDGLDVRFVVNTLAPYLLTKHLLPLLGNNGRVVNLSSAAQAPVSIDALYGKARLDDMGAYAQSKLAITMWSSVLAEKLKDGPMIVAVNPGSLLASKMVKEGFGVEGSDINIGADILTRAALSDEFANASGKYFDNDSKQFSPPHQDALNQQKSEAVVVAIESILEGVS